MTVGIVQGKKLFQCTVELRMMQMPLVCTYKLVAYPIEKLAKI